MRDDLANIGIRVTLVPIEFNTLMANVYNDFDYDAVMMGQAVRRPDPAFTVNFWRSSGSNHMWFPRQKTPSSSEEERADRLIDQIVASTDHTQRKAWWTELNALANEQAWVIWLPVQRVKAPVRSRFANLRPSAILSGASSIIWNAEEIFVKPQARETN